MKLKLFFYGLLVGLGLNLAGISVDEPFEIHHSRLVGGLGRNNVLSLLVLGKLKGKQVDIVVIW